jgi:hypothetical protein
MTAMLMPSMVSAQFGLREVPPKNEFFRFKAQYTVKATGEVLKWNLVRPCRALFARDMNGDSVGLGPGKYDANSYFFNMQFFTKVTADHHAIVVHYPLACDGQTTANGKIPPDLLPFTTWFDDADTMTFGWMYATEDAYKSPLATISFDGATVEAATRDDFLDWQKNAAVGFRPSKIVQSPLGFTWHERIHNGLPISCSGIRRTPLPPEVREMARAAWPSGHPRYWTLDGAKADGKTDQANQLFSAASGRDQDKHPIDGIPVGAFWWGTDIGRQPQSIPTRAQYVKGELLPPVFMPEIAHPYMKPYRTAEELAPIDLYVDIDTDPRRHGFLACFSAGNNSDPDLRGLVGNLDLKVIHWRIGGEPVFGQYKENNRAASIPGRFFERDEFAYSPCVYQKLKLGRSGDEVRLGWQVT